VTSSRARSMVFARPRDFAALVLAVVGVLLLIDIKWSSDAVGLGWAFLNGALFVGYVIVGHKISQAGAAYNGWGPPWPSRSSPSCRWAGLSGAAASANAWSRCVRQLQPLCPHALAGFLRLKSELAISI